VDESSGTLARRAGAFVSIHTHGDLRGCIGHIEPNQRLATLIPRCAIAAATADPRFPPIATTELSHLDIELSILGPLEEVGGPGDVEVGRHGLLVELGTRRGLLLPQVATEWKWDRETFLAQTAHKAGLPLDAWKRGAKVWKFEAEVFADGSSTTKDELDSKEPV
jgi:AmmeMemoRadiSam system protein A